MRDVGSECCAGVSVPATSSQRLTRIPLASCPLQPDCCVSLSRASPRGFGLRPAMNGWLPSSSVLRFRRFDRLAYFDGSQAPQSQVGRKRLGELGRVSHRRRSHHQDPDVPRPPLRWTDGRRAGRERGRGRSGWRCHAAARAHRRRRRRSRRPARSRRRPPPAWRGDRSQLGEHIVEDQDRVAALRFPAQQIGRGQAQRQRHRPASSHRATRIPSQAVLGPAAADRHGADRPGSVLARIQAERFCTSAALNCAAVVPSASPSASSPSSGSAPWIESIHDSSGR